MKIKMKEGCGAFKIKMFKKSWKIPYDEIPQEVYEVVKDKVDIVTEDDLAAIEADKLARVKKSAKRTEKMIKTKWELKHPIEAARIRKAKKPKKSKK